MLRGKMNKLKPTDKAACEMVENFCGYFIGLKAKLNIYEELFEDDEAKLLMEKTAKAFFLDFNEIIVSCLLLEFAKITDRECSKTREGERENCTVNNLINVVDWPDNTKKRLEELKKETESFHSLIEPARNRLLAHYDKESFLSNAVLGTFTSDEGIKFVKALEEICNITHQACFGSIVGDIVVSMPGDVQELKETLRKALVYDRLFSEGNIEERTKLLKYRRKLE